MRFRVAIHAGAEQSRSRRGAVRVRRLSCFMLQSSFSRSLVLSRSGCRSGSGSGCCLIVFCPTRTASSGAVLFGVLEIVSAVRDKIFFLLCFASLTEPEKCCASSLPTEQATTNQRLLLVVKPLYSIFQNHVKDKQQEKIFVRQVLPVWYLSFCRRQKAGSLILFCSFSE